MAPRSGHENGQPIPLDSEPISLLLVDDRIENLTTLSAVLDNPDYRLVTATSGEEALRLILKEDFAVMLIDVMMPGMDGFELARLVRERPRTSDVPIIFVTAIAQEVGYLYRGYHVGAVDYLIKPFDPAIVRAKVAVFVALERQRREIVRQAKQLINSEHMRMQAEMARMQAETAQERALFLAEINQRLANSLDPLASLEELAKMAVGVLCDWCVVDLVDDSGGLRQLIGRHRCPDKAELLDQLAREPNVGDGNSALALAVETHRAQITPAGDDPATVARAIRATNLDVVAQLGAKGVICLPLVARDRTIGVLSLVAADNGITFGPSQIAMAIDVVQQASLTIDNARLYQEARKAVRLRDEFISLASHELRTPMTVLSLQVQTMLMGAEKSPVELPTFLNKLRSIKRQGERLTWLINEMLSVTRLVRGSLKLHLEAVDLTNVVRDVVERMQFIAEKADCRIILAMPEHLSGTWDAGGLDQVVTNLIDNAIKFGRHNPINVRLETLSNSQARLVVQDHGIGIAPEDQKRIFGLYERSAPMENYGGLGLGPFIAKQIVEAMGGTIGVSSVLGEGTTFTVDLPIRELDAKAEPGIPTVEAQVPIEGPLSNPMPNSQAANGDDDVRRAS